MESSNFICGGTKFKYSKGYIGLPVEIKNLPETISILGEALQKKSSFHVSLLCVKDILVNSPDSEQKVLDLFCNFVANKDISFVRYTGEFRIAQNEEKKTLVALCEVSNLEEFSKTLSGRLGIEIPPQPTHVTLYTLQPDIGIGLNSRGDMEQKSTLVEAPTAVRTALEIGLE